MITTNIPLSQLEPNRGQVEGLPKNPRILRDERFKALKKSIEDDPEMLELRELLVYPIEGGQYVVIGGNMRLRVLQDLKAETAPCKVIPAETPVEKLKAYATKDNVGFGDWDWQTLEAEWDAKALVGWGMELPSNWGNLGNRGKTDPDSSFEPPKSATSKLGDVWILGHHRLVCGDSTNAQTVAACLNGVRPHLMVTDPPYGVNYDPGWRNGHVDENGNVVGAVGRGPRALGKVLNDDRADWRAAWALFPGDVAYVWHGGLAAHIVAESLLACGFQLRSQIIWNKAALIPGRGNYHWKHEPCWYVVREKATGHYEGDRKQCTVWDISHRKSKTGHGTQKPVECMKRPIENNSKPGQAVYEPFSGSGTTIIAGEMTGRPVHAIELAPEYVDVGVIRWQEFTGQQAILEATGQKFEEVRVQRAEAVAQQP